MEDEVQKRRATSTKYVKNMDEKRDMPEAKASLKMLYVSLFVGFIFLVVQIVGGVISKSIAIFADSAHLASDLLGFVIAIIGIKFAQRQSTETFSYGYHRAELVGTLTSIASIWVMTAWLLVEATKRFFNPEEVLAGLMFWVAIAGLGFNIVQICVLHDHGGHSHGGSDHGHSHGHAPEEPPKDINFHPRRLAVTVKAAEDGSAEEEAGGADKTSPLLGGHEDHEEAAAKKKERNMQVEAAFLHVLGDLLSSCGVVVAAIIMYFWGKTTTWAKYADPTCTYIFAILVFCTTIPLFKRCLHIMMEGTPASVNVEKLRRAIRDSDPDAICEIHDLHCWKIGGDQKALTVHLRSHFPTRSLRLVTERLREEPWNMNHTTIQTEGVANWKANPENFACVTDMHHHDAKVFHRD